MSANTKIVGFEVEETIWNNTPNATGWDTVKEVRLVARVETEEIGREWVEKNATHKNWNNYYFNPIVVLTSITP